MGWGCWQRVPLPHDEVWGCLSLRSLPGAEPWSWGTRLLFLFSFAFLSVPHELSWEEFSLVSKELSCERVTGQRAVAQAGLAHPARQHEELTDSPLL